MASKLLLAVLVSAVAIYCSTAIPFTINTGTRTGTITSTGTITGPALLDAIVRFKRSAASPEESVIVTLHRTKAGGLQFSIGDCPSGVTGCSKSVNDNSSIRTKRTIDFNIILQILRGILKLFGVRIPDEVFNLFSGATRNVTQSSGNRAGTSSTSSSGAINLEALLG